jgi:hypothetical protein
VTLAVTGNTISGPVFRRYRVTVFQRHRLPLTGSRWATVVEPQWKDADFQCVFYI